MGITNRTAHISASRKRKENVSTLPAIRAELPRFFIEFLTNENDLVLDPFAGSNTTGAVAETLNRKWLSIELRQDYAEDSELRFRVAQVESDDPALF